MFSGFLSYSKLINAFNCWHCSKATLRNAIGQVAWMIFTVRSPSA